LHFWIFFPIVIDDSNHDENHVEISAVIPTKSLSNQASNQDISYEDLKKEIRDENILEQHNFLYSKQFKVESLSTSSNEKLSGESRRMKKQYILLIISLLFLFGSIMYFLLWSETIINPWSKKDNYISPKVTLVSNPTPTETVQPGPTLKPIDKSGLKIQILNGSGIKDVTTGNAGVIEKQTTIIYSNQISADTPKDIQKVLKNEFSAITIEEATQSAQFDVIITTGKGK
jgi:hypothetical protein